MCQDVIFLARNGMILQPFEYHCNTGQAENELYGVESGIIYSAAYFAIALCEMQKYQGPMG